MPDLESRVDALEDGHAAHAKRIGTLEETTAALRSDLAGLRADVATVKATAATKVDVAEGNRKLAEKIDTSVNNILLNALNAVPMRYAWVSLATVSAIVAMLLAFAHFHAG